MDRDPGLTKDQIAKLASIVGPWTPPVGVAVGSAFRDDGQDAVVEVRVKHGAGRMIRVRMRLDRLWLDGFPADELEPHVHRILTFLSGVDANRELEADDATEPEPV